MKQLVYRFLAWGLTPGINKAIKELETEQAEWLDIAKKYLKPEAFKDEEKE